MKIRRRTFIRLFSAILLIAIAGLTSTAGAQTDPTNHPTVELLEAKVNRFFDDLSLDKTDSGFQSLLTGSPLGLQTESRDALVAKSAAIHELYGECRGFERIYARLFGESGDLVMLRYIYKCENYPLIWTFWYYRAPPRGESTSETSNSGWRVIAMRFDTDLRLLELGNE